MKKLYLFLLLLPLLFSCSTNYYYITVNEDTNLFQNQNDSVPMAIIPANVKVYLVADKNDGTYKKIRTSEYTGWVVTPKFTYLSDSLYSKAYVNSWYRSAYSPARSYTTSSSPSSSSGGTVHVKGYYRSNGTYVKPHTRSAPKRH